MKIAFFLTPKADVAWVSTTCTLRQAIERMEHHRYTAVPLLTPDGRYGGMLTEGDILWFLKEHPHIRFEETSHVPLSDVTRRFTAEAVDIDAEIEALFAHALDQNFVPVVDSRGAFIGIVRRRSILEHLSGKMLDVLARDDA